MQSQHQPAPLVATLLSIPPEIRLHVYQYLLVSHDSKSYSASPTFGKGSSISTSILATNRVIHDEAIDVLYSAPQELSVQVQSTRLSFPRIPPHALRKLKKIHLDINHTTSSRGDYDSGIPNHTQLCAWTESLAMILRQNHDLQELWIQLLNHTQKGRGAVRLRSRAVVEQTKRILKPFLFLQPLTALEVGGFDTAGYREWFWEKRREWLASGQSAGEAFSELLHDIM